MYFIVGFLILYIAGIAIYRLYWHPLAAYPGPRLWSITRLPHAYYTLIGRLPYILTNLHEKYGPVIRIAPGELSYTSEDAWNDIYGRMQEGGSLVKDPKQFFAPPSGIHGIMTTPNLVDHARMRRNLSHAFSEKALREQEPIITKYFDKLITKLHETRGEPVDIVKMFNLVTFDVVGDLTFGESFNGLETSELHFWVADIFKFIKIGTITGLSLQFPPLDKILLFIASKSKAVREKEAQNRELITAKLMRRLNLSASRPDFLSQIQKTLNTPTGLNTNEAVETATTIIVGGSETTATLLSGALYYLCLSPSVLSKLTAEVRSAFTSESEINMVSVNSLDYMLAVLNETLRIFPPAPGSFPRIIPPQGSFVAGRFVPGNTVVAVNHWAASHQSSNFLRPFDFVPERWNGAPEYKDDKRKAAQPFSVGLRNCIGRTLAYAEMRVILARVLWGFDVELCEESKEWGKPMPIYVIYQKEPLMLRLRAVAR